MFGCEGFLVWPHIWLICSIRVSNSLHTKGMNWLGLYRPGISARRVQMGTKLLVGMVPGLLKEAQENNKSLAWNRTKCCYHCRWVCSWYSKARRKASDRCVPRRCMHTSSQKGGSGIPAAGDSTHTRKTSPGFLSNPITQLLSTAGEAGGDKHGLQYHLGFKLWICSRPVCKSAKVSGKRIPLSLLPTRWIFSNLPLNTTHDHAFSWPWLIFAEWQQQ